MVSSVQQFYRWISIQIWLEIQAKAEEQVRTWLQRQSRGVCHVHLPLDSLLVVLLSANWQLAQEQSLFLIWVLTHQAAHSECVTPGWLDLQMTDMPKCPSCSGGQKEIADHTFYHCKHFHLFWDYIREMTACINPKQLVLHRGQFWPSLDRCEIKGVSHNPGYSTTGDLDEVTEENV